MTITPAENARLQLSMRDLRRTPEYGFIRQVLLAESAKDDPDFGGLKAHILESFGLNLDHEIEGVKLRRKNIVIV